jgi:hypothetical protein
MVTCRSFTFYRQLNVKYERAAVSKFGGRTDERA